jgi:hypothetical protein
MNIVNELLSKIDRFLFKESEKEKTQYISLMYFQCLVMKVSRKV